MVLRQHHTDAPLLPVADLERFHQFRPDLVDFVIEQTAIEADNRRKWEGHINNYIFAEHMFGKLAALVVGVCGILGGGYLVLQGHDVAGTSIAGASIGTLAVAFLWKKPTDKQ